MISFRRAITCGLLLLAIHGHAALGIVTFDSSRDPVVRPGELTYGVRLDGVAVLGFAPHNANVLEDIEHVGRCSATLITDRHLLTAAHCLDEDSSGTVQVDVGTMAAGFELADRDLLIPIVSDSARLPDWPVDASPFGNYPDIAVLELAETAPAELPRYALYGLRDELGKRLVVAGYGFTGTGESGADTVTSHPYLKRAGTNRFEEFLNDQRPSPLGFDFDNGRDDNNTIQVLGVASDLGEGVDEVLPADGDSGGPTLIHGVVAGIHAFTAWPREGDINDLFDSSFGEVGFATMVSDYREFITAATDGEAKFLDVLGDFNLDGQLDVSDIDDLTIRTQAGDTLAFYDLNDDGQLDFSDRQTWVREQFRTTFGDANLDGEFNSSDLVAVLEAGQYEDDITGNSGWATGDWSGDAEFNTSDLVLAFQDGGYEQGPRPAVQAVPEPTSFIAILNALVTVLFVGRSSRFHIRRRPYGSIAS